MPSAECEICLESYNENNRVPRTLVCDHTLCTSCIIQLLRQGPVKCPFCRSNYRYVISPVDFPVHQMSLSLVSEDSRVTGDGSNQESMQKEESEETAMNVMQLRANVSKANEEGTYVFARLETREGQVRHARVSLCSGRLLLHTLKDDPPPSGCSILSYNKIRALADEVYKVVYMEISHQGTILGKVYIRLLDDAGRTCQFLYLCTGVMGPSYVNTRLLQVTNKEEPGEQVWGGDYENNDGSGGAALPNMVRGPKNHQDCIEGLVAGYYYTGYDQDHNPSHFSVYTKDMLGYVEMSSIGKVLSGLEVMVSIAELSNVRDAFVSDCGLVLCH